MRSKSAREVWMSIWTLSSDMIGRKRRVWTVVNATTVPIDTASPAQD